MAIPTPHTAWSSARRTWASALLAWGIPPPLPGPLAASWARRWSERLRERSTPLAAVRVPGGRPEPRAPSRSHRCRRPRQLEAREEEGDLRARRRRRIGAVHRVLLDVGAERAADRALGRPLRVGRAHGAAAARDRALPLQHAAQHRPRAHDADEGRDE